MTERYRFSEYAFSTSENPAGVAGVGVCIGVAGVVLADVVDAVVPVDGVAAMAVPGTHAVPAKYGSLTNER